MYRISAIRKSQLYRWLLLLKDRDVLYLLPFVWLSLKVRLQFFFFLKSTGQGFPQAADSKWYLHYANALLANKTIGTSSDDLLYLGYNLTLAMLLALFKTTTSILFIQSVTAGLAVILVYHIAKMLFNRTTAVLASFLYCYHTWAITLWSTYILSDSFFISLLLLCVYLLLKAMESGAKVYKILFVVSAFYLLVFRPTGILTMAFILLYIAIRVNWRSIGSFILKYRWTLGSGILSIAAGMLYLSLSGRLDPFVASVQLNAKMILYNVYAKGWIYDSASKYDHFFKPDYNINVMNSLIMSFIVNNWDHVSVIYLKRMAAFPGRWVWHIDLTTTRGLIQFAQNMLPTVLFAIGTVAAMAKGLFKKASIVWLIILAVFVFCVVFFIDGMYRYKAPSTPFIAIVAAFGASSVIHGVISLARFIWGKGRLLLRNRKRSDILDSSSVSNQL